MIRGVTIAERTAWAKRCAHLPDGELSALIGRIAFKADNSARGSQVRVLWNIARAEYQRRSLLPAAPVGHPVKAEF